MPEETRWDVVVIGAGTSGAAAAWHLARRGLRTLCLERSALAEAGARWVNEVPGWLFDEAGIPRPTGIELHGEGTPTNIIAGWGPTPRLHAEVPGGLSVDMRRLVARLQEGAAEAGARLQGNVTVQSVQNGQVETDAGTFRTDFVVDAAGLTSPAGAHRSRVPARHLCAAAQAVHEVRDPHAAAGFFHRHDVPAGEILCFTGVAGGFSVVNVRLQGDQCAILTGSIPAAGVPAGRELLEDFVRQNPWIGDRCFGGWRAIPVCSPFQPLTHERTAYLGDAGCQVFPAHGSGIGSGLVAARQLAEALASGRGVEGYAADWMREYGFLHGVFDLTRRFSQTLDVARLGRLLESGLIEPESTRDGLDQRLPAPGPGRAVSFLRGAARAPREALPLLRIGARLPLLRRHVRAFPGGPPATQASWWKRLNRLTEFAG